MSTALLSVVSRQVGNGLNALGWLILVDGVISASTLVCASGAFIASDVGKHIAIDGAGVGGTIYEGTITGYTSATQVTVSPAVSVTVSGASVSYGGRLRDARRNLVEIREGIFETDEDLYLNLGETIGHWARPVLVSDSAEIAYGAEVPPYVGELGLVLIQTYAGGPWEAGKPSEFEAIQRYRNNTGLSPFDTYGSLAHNVQGSQIAGYYRISEDGEFCGYSGNSMKIAQVPDYVRGTDLQSPSIFTGAIVSGALSRLMPKEGAGASLNLIQIHKSYYDAVIQSIKSKSKAIPTLEQYESQSQQEARAA